MRTRLQVCAHDAVPEECAGEARILITDPGTAIMVSTGPVLVLAFHDAVPDETGFTLASQVDLASVQVFLLDCRDRTITVSCEYGVSRSPAVAAYILHVLHPLWEDIDIVEAVRSLSAGATPNEHVLALIDQRTGRHLQRAFRRV